LGHREHVISRLSTSYALQICIVTTWPCPESSAMQPIIKNSAGNGAIGAFS